MHSPASLPVGEGTDPHCTTLHKVQSRSTRTAPKYYIVKKKKRKLSSSQAPTASINHLNNLASPINPNLLILLYIVNSYALLTPLLICFLSALIRPPFYQQSTTTIKTSTYTSSWILSGRGSTAERE